MRKILAIILAMMLVCSLFAACGGSSEPAEASKASSGADANDQDEEENDDEEADGGDEEAGGDGTITYDLDYIYNNMTEAYGGVLESGEYIGFGINDDGSFSMVLVFTPEKHVTFVGPATVNGNMVTIQDEVNGLQITFEVLYGEANGIIIDLGENAGGGGVLATITVDDLVDTLEKVLTNTFSIG